MNKKIAIITLYGEHNFGNKLQNYALQTVLENNGYIVETLVLGPSFRRQINDTLLNRIKNKLKQINLNWIQIQLAQCFCKSRYQSILKTRISVFKKFSKEYLRTKIISDERAFENLAFEYDYFVIGSDQIWNPDFIKNFNFSFATFAQMEQRIVYAASIGKERISSVFIPYYKAALAQIKYVSVREKHTEQILKKQFNVDSCLVLDPTLLLNASDYKEQFLKEMEINLEEPFVLTYFLDKRTFYPKKELQELCRIKSWQQVDLTTWKNNPFYVSGPKEFLYYINTCKLFLTDSFHGTVFSILFHTSFITFRRGNTTGSIGQNGEMYGRIDHLLKIFGQQTRAYTPGISLEKYLNADFSGIESIQNNLKQKSLEYLEEAMNSE